MKKRNKIFFGSGAVLLAILLVGIGISVACGPRVHSGRCFGPPFHDDFAEFMLWRMDRKVQKLDLKNEQKEKYNELRSKIEAQLSDGLEDRRRMREGFSLEIRKEDPDVKAMAETIKEKISKISSFMKENIDLFVEFYETLDDDQKDKVLEMIRERTRLERT
jgi:hypothetical protein